MERERGRPFVIAAAALLVIVVGLVLYLVLASPCVTLTVGATDAARSPGETVTIHVWVSDNPGFTDLSAYVDYDRERLELVQVEETYSAGEGRRVDYLQDAQTQFDIVMADGRENGYVKLSSAAPIEEKEKMIFGLTFRILPEAEIGVATVSVFGERFTCAHGEKVKPIDSITVEGGILVGRAECMHEDAEKDYFCDLCGVQLISINKIDIKGANLSYDNALQLNFIFTNRLPRNKKYVAEMIHYTADGEKRTLKSADSWEAYGSNFHLVSYPVAAMEMCDEIAFELCDAEGYCYNNEYRITVRDLLMDILEDPKRDDLEKRLYVDTLNFGAAAQEDHNYRVEDLANSRLTATQQSWASPNVQCTDSFEPGVNCVGASLDINAGMMLSFYFNGFSGKNVEKMYAKAIYTDHMGVKQEVTIPGADFRRHGDESEGTYGVRLKELPIADAQTIIEVTVYGEDGSIHGSCVGSAYSYVARKTANQTDTYYTSFAKMAASAKEYFLNK